METRNVGYTILLIKIKCDISANHCLSFNFKIRDVVFKLMPGAALKIKNYIFLELSKPLGSSVKDQCRTDHLKSVKKMYSYYTF